MPTELEARSIQAIESILQQCPRWGIPHFQRGLVWDDSAVSLLLESLYYDTPIGSFVLWKCDNPSQGISWLKADGFDHLIIDGQQRIRSLYQVLEEDNMGEEGDRRVWCVNLRATDECAGFFLPRPKEQPLFVNVLERYLHEPEAGGTSKSNVPPSRFRRNFIGLRSLLGNPSRIDEALARTAPDPNRGDLHALRNSLELLAVRLKSMRGRGVFIRVELEHSLDKIVAIYNRINSAGKRVEGEEKAFALLVAIDPGSNQDITDLFRAVHGNERSQKMERDHVLRRQKERSFGLKLFVRTFAQVSSYHFGSQSRSVAFSFDYVWSLDFATKATNADFRQLWRTVKDAILCVHDILEKELCCDDLRFLPETLSLVPVFQLLTRYPDLIPDLMNPDQSSHPVLRRQVAALILDLYLAECTQARIMGLVRIASDVQARDATETIAKMRGVLHPSTTEKLSRRLSSSNSLLDRYVLMLYWLERTRHARDFSYARNAEGLAKPEKFPRNSEVEIDRTVEAEKQHVVPYSELKKFYPDLAPGGRVGTHNANNIGNLTYISHKLNSFDEGIGSNRLNLDAEPADNLQAHFLDGITPATDAVPSFEAYCRARRDAIADGFLHWATNMAPPVLTEDTSCQIAPRPPRYAVLPLADEIRRLELDDEIECLLVDLSRFCKKIRMPKNAPAGLRMEKRNVVVVTMRQNASSLLVGPKTDELVKRLQLDCPSVAWRQGGDAELSTDEQMLSTLRVLREDLSPP